MRVTDSLKWTVLSAGAAALTAAVARKSMERGWRATTGREPPRNPEDAEATWRDALMWGALTGLGVGSRGCSRAGGLRKPGATCAEIVRPGREARADDGRRLRLRDDREHGIDRLRRRTPRAH